MVFELLEPFKGLIPDLIIEERQELCGVVRRVLFECFMRRFAVEEFRR